MLSRAFDHDVVVVGSGFGGSVAALRLAEKGYDVLVVESGRRFADADFAETNWRFSRFFWVPRLRWFGIQRIHALNDVVILAGAGVGGGSLVYANTLYVPPPPFFADPQWSDITDWSAELAPYYEQAKRMLGVVEENPCDGPVEALMRETAESMGVGHTFRKTPVGVFFGRDGVREPDVSVADPFFGGVGPARTGCTECGNCMVGCRVGAKNTLVKNYLALAERLGVRVDPLRTVVDVRPVDPADPASGWQVTSERTGAWLDKGTRTVFARDVVMAAGTWGTQNLLHRMKVSGVLPHLSDRLGDLTRTNSEALLGAMTRSVPDGVDLTRGVAITASFHPDDETHVENVRYGKGSNAMGSLLTLMADGRPDGAKGGRIQGVASLLLLRADDHRAGHAAGRQLDHGPAQAPPRAAGLAALVHPGARATQPPLDPGRAPSHADAGGEASGAHGRARCRWWFAARAARRADDRALPGRLRDRLVRGARGRRRLRPGVELPRPARRGRLDGVGQPGRQPVADDHRAGGAGVRVVAQPG